MSGLVRIYRDAPPGVQTALKNLLSSDVRTRVEAARSLTKSGFTPAAEVMMERLDDPSIAVVHELLNGLLQLAPGMVNRAARDVQRDSRPLHAKVGADFLASLPGLPHPDDPEATARLRAAPWLVETESDPAVLAPHLTNRDQQIREAITRRMAAILARDPRQAGPYLLKHVPNCGREMVAGLLVALRRQTPDTAVQLGKSILHDSAMRQDAWVAAADFLTDGMLSPDELISFAENTDGKAVGILAASMARHCFDEVLATCTDQLKACSPDHRLQLTRIIGLLGKWSPDESPGKQRDQRRACTHIMIPLLSNSSDRIRRMALLALSGMDSSYTKLKARAMVEDSSAAVRALAVELLGEIGEPADAAVVSRLFHDSDAEVRKEAIKAASALEPDSAMKLALQHITDRDEDVARFAAGMLDGVPPGTLQADALLRRVRAAMRKSCGVVLGAIGRRFPDRIAEATHLGLTAQNPETRLATVEFILVANIAVDRATIEQIAKDNDPAVRLKAVDLLASREFHEWRGVGRALASDKSPEVRAKSAELFGRLGSAQEDMPTVRVLLRDRNGGVRRAALEVAVKLVPEERQALCTQMAGDRDDGVAKAALSHLEAVANTDVFADALISHLRKAAGGGGKRILDHIAANAPDRLGRAMSAAVASRDRDSKLRVIELVREGKAGDGIALLRRLAKDKDVQVQGHAHKALYDMAPDDQKDDMAHEALESSSWKIRLEALEAIEKSKAGYDADAILPLARDEDNDVREKAIRMLARFDDQRVFVELLSSMNDVADNVKDVAEELLRSGPDEVPVLKRYAHMQQDENTPLWTVVRDRVGAINAWASRIGQELLGRPVVVQQYRQGVGRTRRKTRRGTVEIEVSDYAVTSGHPYGEDIMRGIALHEIGHHLADIGEKGASTVTGIAHSEGVGEIYDVLRDERLERVMRSRRPEWGVYFDRLASQVFSQSLHAYPLNEYAAFLGLLPHKAAEGIREGRLPGVMLENQKDPGDQRVRLHDADLLRLPGALTPFIAFLSCLRCGIDPSICVDQRIAKAMALVPPNLKDLSHGELLVVARAIADVIGRSDDHKRMEKQWRASLRRHRAMNRELRRLLQNMRESGQLPNWMRNEAPGIRSTPQPRQKDLPKVAGGQFLNLGADLEFDPLQKEEKLIPDAQRHAAMAATVRKQARALRQYLQRLGRNTVEEYAMRRGARIDILQARKIVFRPTANLLVRAHDEYNPNLYMGVLIDRSGSMDGDKIERAKAFGILLAESARGLSGIDGHVNAFDDDTFYRLGDFRRCAAASLESGGGNNDAGALYKAASLALQSGKKNRLIIMISDGSPTECTFETLRALVDKLTRQHGIVCAQVAVETMENIAFPHFVDLSQHPLDEAVSRFGRLLMKLTASWR